MFYVFIIIIKQMGILISVCVMLVSTILLNSLPSVTDKTSIHFGGHGQATHISAYQKTELT